MRMNLMLAATHERSKHMEAEVSTHNTEKVARSPRMLKKARRQRRIGVYTFRKRKQYARL